MFKKLKIASLVSLTILIGLNSCKKITPDLNVNPNVPSKVDPKLSLSAALVSTARIAAGNPGGGSVSGNDIINAWMGYWTVSGDFIPNANLLRYTINDTYGSSIWESSYLTLNNYQKVIDFYGSGGAGAGAKYTTIARIMKAFLFQRLVDLYNNIPYSEALKGGVINSPKYDKGQAVYEALVVEIDDCVALINSGATASGDDPLNYDVMFGGNMAKWKTFANTIKLKMLINQTQMPGRTPYIQSKLANMTASDFIGLNADATIQPGYANDADNHQNPLWNDIGFTTTGGSQPNRDYFRANIYGVNFYKNNNDPRLKYFYTPLANGQVAGRAYGSQDGTNEKNTAISAIGGNATGTTQTFGTLKSPTQGAIILTSTESLFLQTEAMERGFIPGSANATYSDAVSESFRVLGVPNFATAAATYISQPGNDKVNLVTSANRIRTIITQKWAAMNTYNPLAAWNDWRRLNIPPDLPVSIYLGTTALHIPYRLQYPTTENSYNPENVAAQGPIDPITSKIFWMP